MTVSALSLHSAIEVLKPSDQHLDEPGLDNMTSAPENIDEGIGLLPVLDPTTLRAVEGTLSGTRI